MDGDDEIFAVLLEDDITSWPPLSPVSGDDDIATHESRISIGRLPRGILTLVFNHLSWSDLASAVYTSDVFAEAAFDSAAAKPERPMHMSPAPVVVVLDDEEDESEEEQIFSIESASVSETSGLVDRNKKRRIEEVGEEDDDVQWVGQQLLDHTPDETLVAKRHRIDYKRADTPVLAPSHEQALATTSNMVSPYQDNRCASLQMPLRTSCPGPWQQAMPTPSTPIYHYPAFQSARTYMPLGYGIQHNQQRAYVLSDVGSSGMPEPLPSQYPVLDTGWSAQQQVAVMNMFQPQPGFVRAGWTGGWGDQQ